MRTKLYREIASLHNAIGNCIKDKNVEWEKRHRERLNHLVNKYMPSGSGIDTGTKFVFTKSNDNRLVFSFSFHHMDESGMYDGWADHECIVKPSLMFGIDLRITGRDRNGIKYYLYEMFDYALHTEIDTEIEFKDL